MTSGGVVFYDDDDDQNDEDQDHSKLLFCFTDWGGCEPIFDLNKFR